MRADVGGDGKSLASLRFEKEQAELAHELYRLARNSAYGADRILDSMLRELGAVEGEEEAVDGDAGIVAHPLFGSDDDGASEAPFAPEASDSDEFELDADALGADLDAELEAVMDAE